MWYGIGVGRGWVEIRETESRPVRIRNVIEVGGRTHTITRFKGGRCRRVITDRLLVDKAKKYVAPGSLVRLSQVDAEKLIH